MCVVLCFISPQCYYIGAAETSATKLVREVAKPLSFGKPAEKICEDLKKKDGQICELRYGKHLSNNIILTLCVCSVVMWMGYIDFCFCKDSLYFLDAL